MAQVCPTSANCDAGGGLALEGAGVAAAVALAAVLALSRRAA